MLVVVVAVVGVVVVVAVVVLVLVLVLVTQFCCLSQSPARTVNKPSLHQSSEQALLCVQFAIGAAETSCQACQLAQGRRSIVRARNGILLRRSRFHHLVTSSNMVALAGA